MTLMLASVTNAHEAETAIAGGADVIDLKDPAKGALGALPLATVQGVVQAVSGRVPTSAVVGDLPLEAAVLRDAVQAMSATGVDFVKVGLLGANNGSELDACLAALAPCAAHVKLVAVAFADQGFPADLAGRLAANRFTGVMLDTADKGAGRLLERMSIRALRDFVERGRAVGLLTGLAGALEAPDIPRLLPLKPDVLGFRTALCRHGDRTAGIEERVVRSIAALVHATASEPVEMKVAPVGPDRVIVQDLVVSMPLGAYARERDRKQKVRFDVTVDLAPRRASGDDMGDVFSYDVITDAVAELAESGHFTLVETLAEALAARILAEPRAQRVTIRVAKLELGGGAIGVEITRARMGADG
ncbi:(5-formylfuran-3-yl)methyl phosphate synthase [Rhodoligotrophos ferricapiens]|uniref:(5-formylfuran-3-yl)methyl phosphate synthase n=1 Tax=Rhodoligotrophos ferricapiens TaxID=3069264 RepID=UPI00315CCA74